jgi:hypothetical protein
MGTVARKRSVTGKWRIVEMELWDRPAFELLGPAYIEFARDGTGRFRFIAVEGYTDCRQEPIRGRAGVDFSWEGMDECDPASGRGWAALDEDGSLFGRIYFHGGDDSGFRAVAFG